MVLNDKHQIHSPLIRTFVKFHGSFGVRLSTICWNDWHSILRLSINVLLNILTIYGMYLESDHTFGSYRTRSYLYVHFHRASIVVSYPLCYFITIICYHCYGHHIVQQLDSPIFKQIQLPVNQQQLKSIIIFIIIKLVWDYRFIVRHLMKSFNSDWNFNIVIWSIYLYDTSQMINWYILFYYQWITYLSFRKLISKLSTTTTTKHQRKTNNNNFTIEKRLFCSIRNLSQSNRQLQYYCSYLLIAILIEQINSIIYSLLYIIIDPYKSGVIIPSVITQTLRSTICFLLVRINRKNLQFFDRIYHYFRLKFIGNHNDQNNQISIRYSKFNQSIIYRKYFQLSIFQWLNIDYLFLIHMFSFSLGYIIIISQTTN
uniref:Uncharacterized protein LOC113788463 n=1 Tax=Dermatophagoides pteronyssinus TaxID=6956 RepID=A0A6P6XJZ0_DERPT|nr:uncharacterized protein LOC113788463 [Dermatophagoides pteronyssinus]